MSYVSTNVVKPAKYNSEFWRLAVHWHSPTYKVVKFPGVPAQVEFCASLYLVHVCVRARVSPAEIQTPTHRNLIGSSMNAPPPVSSPNSNSSATFLSLRFQAPTKKIRGAFRNCSNINLLYFSTTSEDLIGLTSKIDLSNQWPVFTQVKRSLTSDHYRKLLNSMNNYPSSF